MSVKKTFISIVRQLGLSGAADLARYQMMRSKNRKKNKHFKREFPDIILPPPYMVYESFQIDFRKYFQGGHEDAEWIVSMARPHSTLEHIKILDWGCGPARIIRHMPVILGKSNLYYGTDYNAETIAWCTSNIPGITFSKNNLTPPLPFQDNNFNLIYGISILTHLSEENQYAWSNELFRVVTSAGIVILTTHGDAFMEKLTSAEAEAYTDQKVILRDKTKEGHRTFGTFHPPAFIRNVFEQSGFTIVEHIPGRRINENYISQDVWILRK